MKTKPLPASQSQSALLILNGTSPTELLLEKLWNRFSFRICADGAADVLCVMKKKPDLILGDFDSITATTKAFFQSVEQLHLPDQYTTDGEKALDFCLKRQFRQVTILGLLGDRLDHTLYNLELIKKYTALGLEITAYTESEKLFVLEQSGEVAAEPGTRISISPVMGVAENVTTEGFEFDVQDVCFEFGRFSSISNSFRKPVARISFTSGQLLVSLQHSLV